MSLSKQCLETLIDLVDIRLSSIEVTDREDAREREILERCLLELRAEAEGRNGASIEFAVTKRRGRRPKQTEAVYPDYALA